MTIRERGREPLLSKIVKTNTQNDLLRYLPAATVFLASTAMPSFLPTGVSVGGVFLAWYEPFLLITACALISRTQAAGSLSNAPMMMYLSWLMVGSLVGVIATGSASAIFTDLRYPLEAFVSAVCALLVVEQPPCLKACLNALLLSLWVSATITLAASFGLVVTQGRSESATLLSADSGSAERYLTAATFFGLTTLGFCLCRWISGQQSIRELSKWLIPSTIIVLLAFSRNHLLCLAVAAILTIASSRSGMGFLTATMRLCIGITAIAVIIAFTPSFLADLPGGHWWSKQSASYSARVIDGISSSERARDPSAIYRRTEIKRLGSAFSKSPIAGNGFGYLYQPPVKKPGSFWKVRARLYAHNFFWWVLAKTGIVGLILILTATLLPVVRAVQSPAESCRHLAFVFLGLLVVCWFAPLYLDNPASLIMGVIWGLLITCTLGRTYCGMKERRHGLSPKSNCRRSS